MGTSSRATFTQHTCGLDIPPASGNGVWRACDIVGYAGEYDISIHTSGQCANLQVSAGRLEHTDGGGCILRLGGVASTPPAGTRTITIGIPPSIGDLVSVHRVNDTKLIADASELYKDGSGQYVHRLSFNSYPILPCCDGYAMHPAGNMTSECGGLPLGPVTYTRIFLPDADGTIHVPAIDCISPAIDFFHATHAPTIPGPMASQQTATLPDLSSSSSSGMVRTSTGWTIVPISSSMEITIYIVGLSAVAIFGLIFMFLEAYRCPCRTSRKQKPT